MFATPTAGTEAVNFAQIINLLEEAKEERKRLEVDLNNSLEFVHNRLDDNAKILQDNSDKLSEYLTMIDVLRQENINLKARVSELEKRLDDHEQSTRVNDLEIHGIPQESNETVLEVVKRVGDALGVVITDDMVDSCHRIGKKQEGGRPRGIVVKFVRRQMKEEILQKRRVKRTLSTRHLGLATDTPIYVNESLCPGRRRLFAAARVAKKEKGYKYLWIRNGSILMRRKENDPIISLKSVNDLEKL
jgi:pimeloyl-CoA synthetase